MSTDIFAYNNSRELAGILSGIKRDTLTRIIVPSRKDKPFLNEHNPLTWQELYEEISSSSFRAVFSPPDHQMILRSIFEAVSSSCREKIASLPGISKPGFLEVLSSDIRELINEAVPPGMLAYDPDSDKPSEFLLPLVYSEYVRYLERYKLMDSAQVCSLALDALNANPDWGKGETFIFAGFLSFNHSQLELVKTLEARAGRLIIIKPEAHLANFGDAASQFGKRVRAKPSAGHIRELRISEPGLEPEMTARTLALWSAGEYPDFPGFDAIALMLDKGRIDAFVQAFRRYGVPYDLMSGIPISQTLPGRILASVHNLSTQDFPTYDTAMLLAQPCFAGAGFPVLYAYKSGRTGLDAWEDFLSNNEGKVFEDALRAVREIRKFQNILAHRNSIRRIIEAFYEFLTAKGLWLNRPDRTAGAPELDESIRTTASAIETIQHKVMTLSELMPDLGPLQDNMLSGEDAYDFLETWCRNTNTRAPIQTANSVRMFPEQPPVLASFPVWIMTGVSSRTWSGNIQSSPLLDGEARSRLNEIEAHLPDLADKAQQKEALFRRLVHTGETLTIISRPLLDDEGRPVTESPFMQRFRDEMKGWTVEESGSEGINILLGGDGFTFAGIDAEGEEKRRSPVITKKAEAVGASDIAELLGCPFLWWQKRQAKIYEQGLELATSADWGNLLHKYWECVWRTYSLDMNAPGSIFSRIALNEWARLTDKEHPGEDYKEFHRLIADPRLQRRLTSIKYRADRLTAIQAGILDALHGAGWTHTKILLEENAHLKETVDDVAFLGQCDRIELLTSPKGAPAAFIVDYKTGNGAKRDDKTKLDPSVWWNTSEWEEFTRGLQLSVYAELARKKGYNLAGVYILGLEDGQVSGTIVDDAKGFFDEYKSEKFGGDIESRVNEGKYAMECAARILERGEFAPVYDSELCKWCKVKSLCRKGEFNGEIIADSDE